MSYRHSSYRKLKRAAMRNGTGRWTPADAARAASWIDFPPPPKPNGWGRPKGWQWPFGAACTDCAPDGVCEQACTDEPRNPKAKPRAAQL